MIGRIVRSVAGMLVLLCISVATASAQVPVLTTSISGNTVTFNWSATAGATGYRLDAGLTPGSTLGSQPLAAVTSFVLPGAPNGVFFVRIVALPGGETSNEVRLQLPAPPAVPTNLQVVRNGTALVAVWTPGAGGGSVTGYQLKAGLTPGSTAVTIPTVSNTFAAGGVPANAYFFRVAAVNAAGASADSAEVAVTMPAGGACDAPPAPTTSLIVFGGYVSLTWAPVPSASAYVLTGYQNGVQVGQASLPGATTRFSITLPRGAWQIDVAAVFSCGSQGAPAVATILIDDSTLKMQPREPDPAPGTALAGPAYLRSVVDQIAAQYPGELRASCGNNTWVFRVVNELRKRDKRWGLNWKRGNVGDMSQDIVTYNFSADPDEGTTKLRAWDIIGGHCGSNPGPNYTEVTNPTPPAFGTDAKWTLLPFIQAGWTP